MKKVLITGVYGLIAGAIYDHLRAQPERYETYGLARRRHSSVRVPEDQAIEVPEERFFGSDLSDLDQLSEIMQGMDVVVHMAAEPTGQAGWDRLLASNIVGAYNVFEACRLAGVQRIIFASSNTVMFGYKDTEPYKAIMEGRYDDVALPIPKITHNDPPRPVGLYPSTKVWGEALAHTYAYRHGLSCICLRIGWVVAEDRPRTREGQAIWCSQRDIVQLVERCINAPDSLRFDVFHGASNNRWGWLDIEHAREVVGYEPQDHGEDYYPD